MDLNYNKILVFDDIIDLEYQERIKNILTGERTFEGYFFLGISQKMLQDKWIKVLKRDRPFFMVML